MLENSNKENERAAQIEKEIDKDKRKLRRRIIYLIIILLLLMLLLVRCMGGCDDNNLIATPDYTSSDKVTKGALTSSEIEKAIKPNYYNIKLNVTPTLENNRLNLRIENPKRNEYACKVSMIVKVNDDEQVFYTSPLIKPDESLEYCTIDKSLLSGRYYAYAQYTLFKPDTEEEVSKTNIDIDLVVK